ncbi:uncharacterized protein Dwil_GK14327 [Drosophila willistoni]|uniref:CHK kinase-like domain-containing protein n=1 Tax=Drosophila willistoni TaxID=7260 RepID=B4NIK1_DROWI|nr:uncharacterized protein Dwil_GK14327 [Drosophila willistoni]
MPSNNSSSKGPVVPDWVKPELFEQTLKDTVKNYKKILKFKVSPGTRPGDNYVTIMLRVEVDVELTDNTTKSISYMLKTARKSAEYGETFGNSEFNIFDTERDMFTNVVQEFKDMYKKAGLEVEFGAKCYKLDIKEDHIILEDLKAKGFRPTERLAGLNKEHTLSVLKKLAQWHAASATRVAVKGPYPEHLNKGLFTEEGKALLKGLSEGAIKYILKSYETIEGHEVYYEAVKNMKEHIMDHIWQVGQVDPNEFNVLNHNDCWLSNIMFQYDEQNQLLDTYLVDYQLYQNKRI